MVPSRTDSDALASGGMPEARVRVIEPDHEADTLVAARLHAELFGQIGPVAKLGERLLQRYCYSYVLRTGLMKAVLIEVDGQPAGLAAYTGDPIALHAAALRGHLPFLVGETMRALFAQPSLLLRLPGAARLLWERRREKLPVATGKFAEVVAFGVLRQYLTRQFVRRTGIHTSDLLLDYVLDDVWSQGFTRVRGVVLASNKPAVSFFSLRASRIDPFPSARLPSIQVWLDLDSGRAERNPHMKAARRPGRSSPTS